MIPTFRKIIRRKIIDEIDKKLNLEKKLNMTATEETEPLISSKGLTSCRNKPQTILYDAISLVSN